MMVQLWRKDGKKGNYIFPEGRVVYQHPKGKINIEPVYVVGVPYETETRYYLEDNGKLQETYMNPFSGLFFRQDGK